ncbi:hypothetical protein SLA2020_378310 [Shorea laevis]
MAGRGSGLSLPNQKRDPRPWRLWAAGRGLVAGRGSGLAGRGSEERPTAMAGRGSGLSLPNQKRDPRPWPAVGLVWPAVGGWPGACEEREREPSLRERESQGYRWLQVAGGGCRWPVE